MNTFESNMSPSVVVELMNDPEFRQQLRQQDKVALEKMGLEDRPELGASPEFKVVTSTRDTTYISMPPALAGGDALSPDELAAVQAAGCVSTAGTAGTGSTFGTVCSSVSTATSAGTLATAGSAGD